MGVYIKMEKPKSCTLCKLIGNSGNSFYCPLQSKKDNLKANFLFELYANCPLIPVPPHGRLIDADAIPYKKIMYDEETDEFYYGVTKPYIDRMPTIIEAEEQT